MLAFTRWYFCIKLKKQLELLENNVTLRFFKAGYFNHDTVISKLIENKEIDDIGIINELRDLKHYV